MACAGGGDDGKPGLFEDQDADDDGYPWDEDCNDENAAINPRAEELCDPADLDEDCDGLADTADDEAVGTVEAFHDADGDSFGDPASPRAVCEVGGGYVTDATDCDDGDSAIHPGAQEVCDGTTDEDCDGYVDDADDSVADDDRLDAWVDADGDGYGADDGATRVCVVGAGLAAQAGDCDDADPLANPAAYESCGGADEDCDGAVDEDDALDAPAWFRDGDGDGYGSSDATTSSCEAPTGYVDVDADCDDTDSGISPSGTEVCDGADDDCDGELDEDSAADAPSWYGDRDGDGYGTPDDVIVSCEAPSGYVAQGTDCDDGSADENPGAPEVCDAANVDEDCDGAADDDDVSVSATSVSTWYADSDGDGYGDADASRASCDAPSSYVSDATDCDDRSSATHPGGTEVCDSGSADEDCDGAVDDADTSTATSGMTTFFRDADGDGYGEAATSLARCDVPTGYVRNDTDCDDTDATRTPAGTEVCDAGDTDEDCDGLSDDDDSSVSAATRSTFYADTDGDGYGGSSSPVTLCDAPAGYGPYEGDCDDADEAVNPGATDACFDSLDTDCDGDTTCSGQAADAGRTFWGEAAGDQVDEVSSASDLDGDGVEDLVASSSVSDSTVTNGGAVYVIAGGGTGDASLSAATTVFRSGSANYYLGLWLGHAGDTDGDGYGEFTASYTGGSGGVVLYDGPTASYRCLFQGVDDPTGGNTVGDTDGDGLDDILIGNRYDSSSKGAAYLHTGACSGTVAYSAAEARILGTSSYDYTGRALSGGDVDGDGLSDVIVGAHGYTVGGGVAIFLAPVTGYLSFSAGDSVLSAAAANDSAGEVVGVGDMDMDGYADVAVGAKDYGTDGAVYVIGGPPPSGASSLSSSDARIYGDASGAFGVGVDLRGDIDGDGRSDLAVGDYSAASGGLVSVFVGPLSGAIYSSDADLAITGDATGDYLGHDVAWIDNGTSTWDLLVAAEGEDTAGADAGAVYLFYGSSF